VESLLALWLSLIGLVIGSFLNVVIARVPHGQSIVKPRSRCPKCGHQLAWYENVPVYSWLFLRGRCRGCKAPISPRYVVVELLTGLLFLACLARFGWSWELVSALVMVTLLVPLTFIDLEHWLLPFSLTIPGIVLGLLLSIPLGTSRLIDVVIGAAAGFLAFWGMEFVGRWVFKKEALGGGDKFLLALLGAFLGWQALLGIIFLSSLQGAVVGGLLLAIRGRAGPAPEPCPGEAAGAEGAGEPLVPQMAPPAAEPHPAQPAAVDPSDPTDPTDPPHPREAAGDPAEGSDEDDWVPGPTNIPFGPWLALAGIEILLFGPWLMEHLPPGIGWVLAGQTGR
jgi:leader peptidase (prepilin peptidase)/N-methyltransferase